MYVGGRGPSLVRSLVSVLNRSVSCRCPLLCRSINRDVIGCVGVSGCALVGECGGLLSLDGGVDSVVLWSLVSWLDVWGSVWALCDIWLRCLCSCSVLRRWHVR